MQIKLIYMEFRDYDVTLILSIKLKFSAFPNPYHAKLGYCE